MKNTNPTKRLWDGVEVQDANRELRIFANASDIVGATPNDWGSCVFARACNRLFGSRRVVFFRRVAYVELPAEDGSITVERFAMTEAVAIKIEKFDKDHIIPPGGFLLLPPTRSDRLDARIEANSKPERKAAKKKSDKIRREVRRKAALKGVVMRTESRDPQMIVNWRSGVGMVHFGSENPILKPKNNEES